MGNWKWEGVDRAGKSVSGVMEAKDEREVKKSLRNKGIKRKTAATPPLE